MSIKKTERTVFHIEVIYKVQTRLPTYHQYYGNWSKLFDEEIKYFPKSKEWYRGENKKFPLVVQDSHDLKVTVRKGTI